METLSFSLVSIFPKVSVIWDGPGLTCANNVLTQPSAADFGEGGRGSELTGGGEAITGCIGGSVVADLREVREKESQKKN